MKKLLLAIIAAVAVLSAKAYTTDTVSVAAKYIPGPAKAVVITPRGEVGQRFPTVYILNGYTGSYKDWTCTTEPRLGELADRYGMIFVMPDGRDSWYWDSPAQPGMQMESFITKELVPYIDSKYPTKADASQRAITGLSMGGHGALWLATRHPDIWRNAGSMSGGVDITKFTKRWKMAELLGKTYEQDPELWQRHAVASLVPQMKDAGLNIVFDCGSEDFFAGVNEALHKALLDAGVPHEYTSRPGNHSHKYWANSIRYHLYFFDKAFRK